MGETSNLTERESVERQAVLPAAPDEVWEALTDGERLEQWLAEEVELDPVEGGTLATRDGERERTGTVETVVERKRLAFTWAEPGGQDPSRVELELEPVPGGTRLLVTETRLAGPSAVALAGSSWAPRLQRLGRALELVPFA
ncbi:MAG: SRPBCC domain-containing protein [Actinomycetota bacterium]|nr:SRPBCC domain-containing protein [Actinomycetota bacterium]